MQTFFGWKPILLLCCAAFSTQITHAQTAPESTPPVMNDADDRPESRPVSRTLADLGHGNGFQQTAPDSSIRFVMPMPLDTAVTSARLVLHYAAPAMTQPEASMRVSLNGLVRQVVSLADAAGPGVRTAGATAQRVLSVPLTPEDLGQPFLEVAVRGNFGASQDRCAAPDSTRHFLSVMPQTSLNYRVQPNANPSVRGFLSTLPTNTRIAISPGVNDEALRATWLISGELQSRGHRVSYAHLRDGADILIGPRRVLSEQGVVLPDDADLGLVSPEPEQPYRFQLAMAEPYNVDALAAPWNLLLGGQHYTQSTASPAARNTSDTLPLAALGLDTEARDFSGSTQWTIDTGLLPPGRTPSALRLDLVVPPSSSGDPLVLYALQGATVRGLATLPEEGGHQSASITLDHAQSFSTEPVRIVLMRQSSNDCTAAPTAGFAQILDSSVLTTASTNYSAENVVEFGRMLGGAFSVHLPDNASAEPHAWARTLAGLGRSLDLDPRMAELRTTSMQPPDNRSFIWFGEQPPQGFEAPVAISRGRIQVQQRSGEVLLDSGEMPEASMVSLLRNGSQRGLWLRTLGGGVPVAPPGLERSTGDLIFGDQNGVLVALATGSDTVVGVDYPDHQTWTHNLARYRIWLFALIWAVLTIVVIVVARRMRKNK